MQRCVLSKGCKAILPAVRPVPRRPFLTNTKIRPAFRADKRSSRTMVVGGDEVAASYATALMEIAEENKTLESMHTDMEGLAMIIKENEEFQEVMTNPIIDGEIKKTMLKEIAQEAGFDETILNFLCLLIDQDCMVLVESICEAFEEKYCIMTETQVATLRSSTKLDPDQQFLIAKKLQEISGAKNIKLKPVIDPSLMAGFVVEYGSSQIDMSLKGQLEDITAELLTSRFE